MILARSRTMLIMVDAVVWLGDFNYRIGLSSETARALVKRKDLETLYENDQLNLQMVAGLAFKFYSEARIGFMPTYRFDLGSDEYDTSEKARIPAWTDRILKKGTNLRQLLYDSAPLKFSDHRPVYAAFECRVVLVDEARREAISKDLYRKRKADVQDSGSHVGDFDDTEDEDLIGYDAIEPGLPPASSDRQKWWLDNKQPARAQVAVPNGRDGQPMVLNPSRSSNPFGHNEENDWISVSRSPSQASMSSLSSSPYEKVAYPNMTSSLASSTTPRKLPPPHDANNLATKVGRMSLAQDQGSIKSETAPPPPPPRRQGTAGPASTQGSSSPMMGMQQMQGLPPPLRPTSAASHASQDTSQLRGKPAPPVAKKPAHLASSPKSTHSAVFSHDGTGFQPSLPARTNTGNSTSSGYQDVARKPVAASSNGSRSGPALPSRGPPPKQNQGPVDLLGSLDEGGQDMGGWETLQPSMK